MAKTWAYRAVWGLLIAVYLLLPLGHLGDYAYNYDEGPQLQAAALVSEGHPLYSDVVVNKPPLLSWLLALGFRIGGPTVETARLTVLLTTLIGFVALGVLAEQMMGRGAGAMAMALFLLLPEVPVRAAVVMNDLPAMSLALVSLAAAGFYRRTGRWGALAVSAVAYALSILFHPLLFFMAVPGMLILFYPARPADLLKRTLPLRVLAWGVIILAVVALAIAPVDLRGLVRWVFEYNLSGELTDQIATNWEKLWEYWQSLPWILTGLAAVSAGMALSSRRSRLWLGVLGIWGYLTAALLLLLRPLWQHYGIFLLYPLILVLAGGMVTVARWAAEWRTSRRQPLRQAVLGGLLVLGMVGLIVLRAQMPLDWKPWAERRLQALPLLQEACASGQPVITDNQFLAFAAGCRVPPSLADTSVKRIDARLLSESTVTDVLLQQQIPLVLVDSLQFGDLLEVERGLRVISSQSTCFEETCLYYPDRELLNPTLTPETLVGEAVRLWGYTLKGAFEPGETPQVVLYWESVTPVQENWKVFVHLMDEAGALVAQHDGVPFAEASPTSTWRAGERIIDPHVLELPSDLPPGTYRVVVGMYREATAERLPATSSAGRWPNDGIIVTEVEVRP